MDITLQPSKLAGSVTAPPSKSMAHRILICAAFGKKTVTIFCPETNQDIEATADCLRALGAEIHRTTDSYIVTPVSLHPASAELHCRESGATLRFLLPIVGALGVDATLHMEGRLPQRPLSPLWEEMERMGCQLSRPSETTVRCQGKLRTGHYAIHCGASSQFISGLLLALPLIGDRCHLQIQGKLESAPYVDMTVATVQQFHTAEPEQIAVEGDWSSAAFWLAANALGSAVSVEGLDGASLQGDRDIIEILPKLQACTTLSVADIPDLMPILSVVAAAGKGAVFTNIHRLRYKESDRIATTVAMLRALGGSAVATADTLTVYGTGLQGGTVDSYQDHRIAMSAAIAATVCSAPVTILGAECVKKSYPGFWSEYTRLGGNYGEILR